MHSATSAHRARAAAAEQNMLRSSSYTARPDALTNPGLSSDALTNPRLSSQKFDSARSAVASALAPPPAPTPKLRLADLAPSVAGQVPDVEGSAWYRLKGDGGKVLRVDVPVGDVVDAMRMRIRALEGKVMALEAERERAVVGGGVGRAAVAAAVAVGMEGKGMERGRRGLFGRRRKQKAEGKERLERGKSGREVGCFDTGKDRADRVERSDAVSEGRRDGVWRDERMAASSGSIGNGGIANLQNLQVGQGVPASAARARVTGSGGGGGTGDRGWAPYPGESADDDATSPVSSASGDGRRADEVEDAPPAPDAPPLPLPPTSLMESEGEGRGLGEKVRRMGSTRTSGNFGKEERKVREEGRWGLSKRGSGRVGPGSVARPMTPVRRDC